MKKKVSLLILFVLLVGVFLFGVLQLRPVGGDNKLQRFMVLKGSTTSDVASSLEKQGLIKSSFIFRIYARLTGAATHIQAGEYELSANYSIPEILTVLLKGPTEVWVTIPEGFRREQIAEKFVSSFGLSGVKADSFVTEFMDLSGGKEGYLFPDTYLFPKDANPGTVVNLLSSTFKSKVGVVDRNTLILASIIERETLSDSERAVVAGILLKRLNVGWPLQADATVIYARDNVKCKVNGKCDWWAPVISFDLSIDSNYNTYKFAGLPPGPICSPGLSSIDAVRHPKDSPYWYYLHDSKGNIHYATTIEEQDQNIKTYLQ